MTILLNHMKVKELSYSPLADQTEHPAGKILQDAQKRLETIKKAPGCKCKYGPQRRMVYEDVLSQLSDLSDEDLNILKEFLNTTTIIIGSNGIHR